MALGAKAGRLESCKHCSALRLLVSDVSTHGTLWGAGTGGARSRAMRARICPNIHLDTATSAIWNVT